MCHLGLPGYPQTRSFVSSGGKSSALSAAGTETLLYSRSQHHTQAIKAVHVMFDAALKLHTSRNSESRVWIVAGCVPEDTAQRLSTMSHLPPELPSPCQQKSIKTQVIEVIEINEVVQRSLPSDYSINGQDVSIGQARKRAIAVLIVLTNLVPVCQPHVLFRTC